MANVAFTRDEAILLLDMLFFSGEEHFFPANYAIVEQSNLLNELPIHPMEKRSASFRNPTGISKQINTLKRSLRKNIRNNNVGYILYQLYEENQNQLEPIHELVNAIKRNKVYFQNHIYSDKIEANGFPEGVLLGHLHCSLEIRDSKSITHDTECNVCCLNLSEIYKPVNGSLMQLHLIVPITELDYKKTYKLNEFITVCPNCHAVLHRFRPWATKETIGKILR